MSTEASDSDRPRAEVYRPSPGEPVWYEEERDGISVVQVLNVLLRHRWKVLGPPLVVAAFAVGATILWPPTYTSTASIVPQSGSGTSGMGGQLSQLSGVASQFGISVPGAEPGQSPQFYADLITSRRLLEEAVTSEYWLVAPTPQTTREQAAEEGAAGSRGRPGPASRSDTSWSSLIELYGIEAPSRGIAVSKAARRLEGAVSVTTDTETGVVELAVTTPWPAVSMQVTDRLVSLVNRFNNRVRRTQASAQAAFVQERLQEARRDLRAAEDSLEAFLERNVGWQQSPELRFAHDRLQRRVNLKQQVYTSLASRYEEARIAEVKNTPVVTTVTHPKIPERPDPGRLPLKAAVGLVLGGIVGLTWAFGAEFVESVQEENTDDYREFVALKKNAVRDVKRVGRRLRRAIGSGRANRNEDE